MLVWKGIVRGNCGVTSIKMMGSSDTADLVRPSPVLTRSYPAGSLALCPVYRDLPGCTAWYLGTEILTGSSGSGERGIGLRTGMAHLRPIGREHPVMRAQAACAIHGGKMSHLSNCGGDADGLAVMACSASAYHALQHCPSCRSRTCWRKHRAIIVRTVWWRRAVQFRHAR